MRFIPSEYGVEAGAEESAPTPTTSADYTTYATAARAFLGLDEDVRTQLLKKQAILANYKKLAAASTGLVRTAYLMKIRTLEAEIAALETQAQEAGVSATSIVATKVAVSGMAILGVFAVGLLGYN